MDLCTGPLARASRLSADALTCGWPDGQPCGLPTRPTTGRRLHTSSTGLHHDRPNRARQECKGPVRRSGLASRHDSTSGAASPLQYDIVPTIFPAQHSIGSESVTLPKSPVTFAEIRTPLVQFLALSPRAQAYREGLEARRVNARVHLRQILALAEMYGREAVARTVRRRRDKVEPTSQSTAFRYSI